MYIAIEYNEDGTINDNGSIEPTMKEALEVVKHVFYIPDTRVHKIVFVETHTPVKKDRTSR